MKLVKLTCPNCHANLEVNSEMKQFTCNYCGTTTLLDDEKIKVDVTYSKLDSEIKELEDVYTNGNVILAYDLSTKLLKKYPNNKKIKDIYDKVSPVAQAEIKYNKQKKEIMRIVFWGIAIFVLLLLIIVNSTNS